MIKKLFLILIVGFGLMAFAENDKLKFEDGKEISNNRNITNGSTAPVVSSTPKLSNFTIRNLDFNRIYFQSNIPITGSSISGFTVSYSTITAVHIEDGAVSGHYFTVSKAFNYWDNITIRYEGGSNIASSDNATPLNEFTLEYINNEIPEPQVNGDEYFVSTSGNDGNDGTSQSSAFRTIKYALTKARPGVTIWVKAGQYGNETFIDTPVSGEKDNPIKIIGYKNTPGDITSMYYSFGSGALNTSEMPTFTGPNNDSKYAFYFNSNTGNRSDYIVVKNFQFQAYKTAIYFRESIGLLVDNCIFYNSMGYNYKGRPLSILSTVSGNKYTSAKAKIKNSLSVDAANTAFSIWSSGNLVENCKSYSTRTDGYKPSQDYFFDVNGSDNIVRKCHAERISTSVTHQGHGIGVKTNNPHYNAYYNLFELNYVKGIRENYYVRNTGADYNVFKDNEGEGFTSKKDERSYGIAIWGGVNYNIFERMYIHNCDAAFEFLETAENGNNDKAAVGNIIINSRFDNIFYLTRFHNYKSGIVKWTLKDTKIINCTFNNVDIYARTYEPLSDYIFQGNEFVNCIFNNCGTQRLNDISNPWDFSRAFGFNNNNFFGGLGVLPWAQNSNTENPHLDVNFRLTDLTPDAVRDGGLSQPKVKFDADWLERINGSYSLGAYEDEVKTTGSVSPNTTICVGESTTLIAYGGSSYQWNTGETTDNITVNPSETTTYSVIVSDGTNSGTHEVTVTVEPAPSVDAGEDVSICLGETVTLTATGEGDFLWSTGETTPSITVTPTDTVTYSVTASNPSCGITVTDEIVVTVGGANSLDVEEEVSVCQGENITLIATSTGDVLWSTGETTPSITVAPTETTTYTVTSTVGSCSLEKEIVVTVDTPPSVNAGEDQNICEGEVVTLTAEGNGDFLWSTGETTKSITVTPDTPTTYTVTASNACGTSVIDEVAVIVSGAINLQVGDDVTICEGETVSLTASGNGKFFWSTGEEGTSIAVSPTETTTYTVQAQNWSCVEEQDIVVTVIKAPVVDAGEDVTICDGENITLTATGEGDFLWSTGETTSSITVNPNTTTTYTVTASNATCSTSVNDEIVVNVARSINLSITDDTAICEGESITLTATSNESVLWSTGETTPSITVSPNTSTQYTVTSSNGNCSKEESVIITVNPAPTVFASSDRTICAGESVTLTASGNGNFVWSTGEWTSSITVSPTTTTTYTITSSNSCSTQATDEVVVTVNPAINLSVSNDVSICEGESVALTATSNESVVWSTGETTPSITVSPTSTRNYTVSSSNSSCSDEKTIRVTVNSAPTVIASPDVSICSGDSVTLTASGSGNFTWSTGETGSSISVSPTETTAYTVSASSSCASDVSDQVIVTVNPAIDLSVSNDVSICEGESVTLTATSNESVIWNTGETTPSITVSPNDTAIYTVSSSNTSCSDSKSITVTVNAAPSVVAIEDVSICEGESVTLTASGSGNFTWSTGETGSSIVVSPSITTAYTVSASGSCASDVSDEVIVTVNSLPELTTSGNITVERGERVTLTATGEGDFLWSTGETTPSIIVSPDDTTTYTVLLTSNNSCTVEDKITVTISEPTTGSGILIVNAGEDITVCKGQKVQLRASGGDSYLWSTDETSESIIVSPTESKIYSVRVGNGEAYELLYITVYIDKSCSTASEFTEFKVYPNPTYGKVTIDLLGYDDAINIDVVSIGGKVLYSKNLSSLKSGLNNKLTYTLDLSKFSKGVYIVRLFHKDRVEAKKIMHI